ncbi:hypothetical protein SAMN05421687_102172 [Salimicrobium flavidum]|uniref:Uncharacterized protein n=1 Tax=Salimicrobium flavidum TaxID=570947 RepID=A0A1N7ITC0_9BACI|nr:hypothetical protein SAMN05421687_102172 [Salimicrobium flavidum]
MPAFIVVFEILAECMTTMKILLYCVRTYLTVEEPDDSSFYGIRWKISAMDATKWFSFFR